MMPAVETITLVGNEVDGYSLRLIGDIVTEAAKSLGFVAKRQVVNLPLPASRDDALKERAKILRIVENYPWNH